MITLLFLVSAGVSDTPRQDEAVRVIEKAVAALGVRDAKGEMAIRITGKATIGGRTTHYVRTWCDPHFIHDESVFRDGQRVVQTVTVFNGKTGWVKEADGTREMTRAESTTLHEAVGRSGVQALENLTDPKRFTLTLLPELKEKDDIYVGLRVQSENQSDTYLYFSKRTHLLWKSAGKKSGPDGKTYDAVEYRTEYKRFAGQLYATRKSTKIEDIVSIEEEIEKVEYLPVKDVKHLFAKP